MNKVFGEVLVGLATPKFFLGVTKVMEIESIRKKNEKKDIK
jgi:hypothetical protein